MSIKELVEKINPFYNLLLILVLAVIFFTLGRLSALEERHKPLKIESLAGTPAAAVMALASTSSAVQVSNIGGEVIGSKSGKKYYFPWCGTVKRIKPQNQVSFSSIEEARKAGFLPGANCKGLK